MSSSKPGASFTAAMQVSACYQLVYDYIPQAQANRSLLLCEFCQTSTCGTSTKCCLLLIQLTELFLTKLLTTNCYKNMLQAYLRQRSASAPHPPSASN